jgi:hypothetical protein
MRTNLILLILALLLAIPTALTLAGEDTPTMAVEDFPPLLPGFNPDNVGVITLARKRPVPPGAPQPQQPQLDQLVFFRSETGGWALGPHPLLQGLPIKENKVESEILDHLKAIRLDRDALDTAQADPDYLAERHLTEDSALIVTCGRDLQNEPLAEVFKGIRAEQLSKQPGAVQGYYVCRKDKPREVVVYDPSEPWEPVMDANEWVDKVIYDILMGDVESFRIKNAYGTVGFKKKKGSQATWVKSDVPGEVPENVGAVRQMEVTNLLEQFRKVTAEDFEGPIRNIEQQIGLEKIGLAPDKSRYEFRATLKDGQEYRLRAGHRVPNKPHHYAVTSNNDFVFTLRDFAVNPLNVEPKDLFDPAPPKKPEKEPQPAGKDDPDKDEPKKGEPKTGETKKGEPEKAATRPAETPTSRKQGDG